MNITNDIRTLFLNIDDSSIEYINELALLQGIQISNYQIFINIFFLLIIFGTFYILYRDYIYRIASKMTRCADIGDIVNLNIDINDDTYIYNIYIVHVNNSKNILKDFIIKLEYNFIEEKTNIIYGEYKNILPVLFSSTNKNINKISNGFYIFDLEEKDKKYISYYDKDDRENIYYFDRSKLINKKYKYFVTSNNNKKLTDNNSLQLAYFVRRFSYNDNISLDPIYNILYAIENKKNMEY
jgi:hypothetical protein